MYNNFVNHHVYQKTGSRAPRFADKVVIVNGKASGDWSSNCRTVNPVMWASLMSTSQLEKQSGHNLQLNQVE